MFDRRDRDLFLKSFHWLLIGLMAALALAIATIPIRERAWEEGAAAGWKMIGLFRLERAVTLP